MRTIYFFTAAVYFVCAGCFGTYCKAGLIANCTISNSDSILAACISDQAEGSWILKAKDAFPKTVQNKSRGKSLCIISGSEYSDPIGEFLNHKYRCSKRISALASCKAVISQEQNWQEQKEVEAQFDYKLLTPFCLCSSTTPDIESNSVSVVDVELLSKAISMWHKMLN